MAGRPSEDTARVCFCMDDDNGGQPGDVKNTAKSRRNGPGKKRAVHAILVNPKKPVATADMRHRQQPAPPLKIPCGKSRRPRRDCVPMTVIVASKTSVILLDEKYTPYPRRGVQIENICGMFATYVELGMLRGLIVDTITPFGVQHTLYHVDGTLVVDQGRGFFKGCRSFEGIVELSRCLYLERPKNRVHMLVLTARLGKRVQVSKEGYMEAVLAPHYGRFTITPRMDEENCLRLEITTFTGPFEIAPEVLPLTNDWTVTGRGAVIARFTWDALDWDATTEARVLEYSRRVVALLEASC